MQRSFHGGGSAAGRSCLRVRSRFHPRRRDGMANITSTVEIARTPEEVFAYIDEVTRHGEWQEGLLSARLDTDGPVRVGSRVTEVRKIGGRELTMSYEITEHDPPRAFAFRV